MIRGGWNRSVVTVVTVGNGVTRRPSALNRRGVVRWNLVQWCHNPSQTVVSDPGSSVVATCSSSEFCPVSPVCWSESADDEDWPDEWWHDSESDWMED